MRLCYFHREKLVSLQRITLLLCGLTKVLVARGTFISCAQLRRQSLHYYDSATHGRRIL